VTSGKAEGIKQKVESGNQKLEIRSWKTEVKGGGGTQSTVLNSEFTIYNS
jgi:hypothetical protein